MTTETRFYFIDVNDERVGFDIFDIKNKALFLDYAEGIGNVATWNKFKDIDTTNYAVQTVPAPHVTGAIMFDMFRNDSDYIEQFKKHKIHFGLFDELLLDWLSSVIFENYRIDKKYLDVAWICIENDIYDGDSIWEDWNDYLENL